ncbi:hypothetical protein FPV67DRAFT_1167575 [Lyophyllum atratum]|nr:hypothetical protein FPV67DRAFT_1167575 [Lyophyllum atratum]
MKILILVYYFLLVASTTRSSSKSRLKNQFRTNTTPYGRKPYRFLTAKGAVREGQSNCYDLPAYALKWNEFDTWNAATGQIGSPLTNFHADKFSRAWKYSRPKGYGRGKNHHPITCLNMT